MKNKKSDGTVLIVDDMIENLRLLSRILIDDGYKVRTAKSGLEAIASTNTDLPDLILLGIKMPDIDGYEVCMRLKANEKTNAVPVLFLSALGGTEDKLRGFEVGGVDFITKPFNAAEVLVRVKTHIEINRLQAQLEEQTNTLKHSNKLLKNEITERKKNEGALRESKQLLQNIIDNSPSMIYVFDTEGKAQLVNRRLESVLNLPNKKIIGNTRKLYLPEEIAGQHRNNDLVVINSKRPVSFQEENLEPDGKHFYLTEKFPLTDLDGKVYAVGGISTDITERKRVEEELKRKNTSIQIVLDNLPIGIALNEIDKGSAFYLNKKFEEIYGWPGQEMNDIMSFFKKVYPDDTYREELMTRIMADIQSGDISRMHWEDCKITHKDGSHHQVNAVNIPLIEQNTMVSTVIDVTEVKNALQALSESEEKYRKIFEDGPMGIAMATMPDGRILNANKSICEMLGYTKEEMKLLTFIDVTHPDHRIEDIEAVKKLSEGKIKKLYTEKRFLKKNGAVIWAFRALTIIKSKDGKSSYAIEILNNITEKKQAEEELINSKKQLELLYKHLNDVRETERSTISREIHDELGQSLTALKIDLNWTKDKVGSNLDLMKKLNGMIEIVNETIKKVQKISSDLRPAMLDDLGLIPAIEWYCQNFEEHTGLKCYLELKEIQAVSPEINVTLFRILQEGMTNITRHADAKCVEVKLYSDSNFICLKIKDDGIGFNNEKLNPNNSLGLIGIKERVKLCNGNVEIISSENNGTELIISIPIIN